MGRERLGQMGGWIGFGSLLVALFALVVVSGVVGGTSSFERINAYYGKLLDRRELNVVSGPHFWKDGRIFWAGPQFLESSGDFGATSAHEDELPRSWKGPARFVSETILADRRNVYVKIAGHFERVLTHFRCWYVCGSQLRSGDLVIGEYGNRIYRVNATTEEATLILEKPTKARHFHVTAVDPFTNDIYTSLGDALKQYVKFGDRVTGIMRSQDEGKSWQWLYETTVGSGAINRQPTAVYFDKDDIIFGTDCKPHGIFVLDRRTGRLEQVYAMPDSFRSWFTEIEKANGSYWALSRAFLNKGFGFLWWSADGKAWTPVQVFAGTPVWLQMDEVNDMMSVGFFEPNSNVVAFKPPAAEQMAKWVKVGPTLTLTDQVLTKIFAAITSKKDFTRTNSRQSLNSFRLPLSSLDP
jgi:hypothetical protein